MDLLIINGNPVESDFNISISEIVYALESENVNVMNVTLNNFDYKIESVNRLKSIIESSDMIIYASPIIEGFISDNLLNFMDDLKTTNHPNIFVILECNDDVTVDSVNEIVEYFEQFSTKQNARILDIQYLTDAKNALIELLS